MQNTNIITGKTVKVEGLEFFVPNENNNLLNIFEIKLLASANSKIKPVVTIIREVSSEDYDYDYEDELVYNGIISDIYYTPIKYNPFSGKEYIFESKEVIDRTQEYHNLLEEQKEVEKRKKSNSKTKKLYALSKKLNMLFSDIPKVLYADNILVEYNDSEHEMSPICFIEEANRKGEIIIGENILHYEHFWLDDMTFVLDIGDSQLKDNNDDDYFIHVEYHKDSDEFIFEIWFEDDNIKADSDYLSHLDKENIEYLINEIIAEKE